MNNKRMRLTGYFVILVILSGYFFSCEKEVDFDLKDTASKLVVEGSIETGMPPIIRLSKTIGIFKNIDFKTLSNSAVHDAIITVSNGAREVVLKEYALSQGDFSLYFYTIDTTDFNAVTFIGQPGNTYSLTIELDQQKYTSITTIPFVQPLDSLWTITPPEDELPKKLPDARRLYIQYTDPDTLGNSVRYFTKRNKEEFLTSFNSVFNDELINGQVVRIPLPAGVSRIDTTDSGRRGYFLKGDTVTVKWSAIDRPTFDFWSTLEYAYGAAGNPFASPIEISSNIEGDAIGIWAGYGSSYMTIIIED